MLSLSATVLLGLVGALVMYVGWAADPERIADHTAASSHSRLSWASWWRRCSRLSVSAPSSPRRSRALERTREILDEAREDQDPHRTVALGPIDGHVEFEDVSFEYETGKPSALWSLVRSRARAPSRRWSVHPDPANRPPLASSHRSTSRGKDVCWWTAWTFRRCSLGSFRAQLGVVLQESFLFDGTIGENVAFARPDATREEIERALPHRASVDEFVERFPDGYDTVVG